MSEQPVNLFNFGEGFLKFMIKISANVSFKIGIIDAWGNQNYVDFPANQTTYGLSRNGDWGQASIPVEDIRGELIDLRMLSYEFVILEVNGTSCEFGLDDIYWEGGTTNVNDKRYIDNDGFNLQNNYPNPFNTQTSISYSITKTIDVELIIYDINGRIVKTLVNETQSAGTYTVNWSISNSNEPSGMYFYKLNVGSFTKIKKCYLQR